MNNSVKAPRSDRFKTDLKIDLKNFNRYADSGFIHLQNFLDNFIL